MSQTSRSPYPLPTYRGTPLCNRFFLNMDGRFAFVSGDALDRTGISAGRWGSITAFDLAAECPELAGFYGSLLKGRSAETVCAFGGTVWRVVADPVFQDGEQIGATGVAWVLEPEPDEQPPPDALYQLWEAAGDNARFHVWSGDRFHVAGGGVVQYRRIPIADFDALRDTDPTRLHLLRDGRPAPHLRLLGPG